MQIPKSIKIFEKIFLISLLLNLIRSFLIVYGAGLSGNVAYVFSIAFVGDILIYAFFFFMVVRKKSVTCQWLLVSPLFCSFLFNLVYPSIIYAHLQVRVFLDLVVLFYWASFFVCFFSFFFLFKADSRAWFSPNVEMPESIRMFEKWSLGSLLLSAIPSVLIAQSEGLNGQEAGRFLAVHMVSMIVFIVLLFRASRKKSKLCKWLTVILFSVCMVFVIANPAVFIDNLLVGLTSAIVMFMEAYAIYMLFHADSSDWFFFQSKS